MEILKTPIENLKLSARATNKLKAAKIDTLHELVQFTCEDIKKFKQLGTKLEIEIEIALLKHGLCFGLNVEKLRHLP